MVKRAKLEIIKDILKVIQENRNSVRLTPLLRKSKLSSAGFKEYYTELIQRNLVKEIGSGRERKVSLTERGMKFLEKYRTIIDFIDEFEL
ncbi:MAG: winged helix-turn-helix domain-containing protein [Candidatus Pacearchaeota archaeon]